MILVDTSVWVDHLRHGDVGLTRLLNTGQVLTHRFVIGEKVCEAFKLILSDKSVKAVLVNIFLV